MVSIGDLRLMNDTTIIYLTKMGVSTTRNEIIKEILKDDKCFFKMAKEDAYGILQDIGVDKDNIEDAYASLLV